MPTETNAKDKIASMQGQIDTKDEEIATLKRQCENYVAEINRLGDALKQSNIKLSAYQIVMTDIIKRG